MTSLTHLIPWSQFIWRMHSFLRRRVRQTVRPQKLAYPSYSCINVLRRNRLADSPIYIGNSYRYCGSALAVAASSHAPGGPLVGYITGGQEGGDLAEVRESARPLHALGGKLRKAGAALSGYWGEERRRACASAGSHL